MPIRQPLVLANWKMHGNRVANKALLAGINQGLVGDCQAQIGVCPPSVYLSDVAAELAGSNIALGAQDLSPCAAGAHTGDIAGEMLKEVGCHYVLVGHSERRADHQESHDQVAQKYWRAIASGLEPVLCVGETLKQREAGQTLEVVSAQLDAVLIETSSDASLNMVVAYEPVWAIGTGKTATAEQAQVVHKFIRQRLAASGSGVNPEQTRILYGGSVKPNNAVELFSQPDIDGGLIGGASLEAESFLAICRAANES